MHRAVRSTATVRNANRIGRRMAGSRAHVNGFLLGLNNGEGVVPAKRDRGRDPGVINAPRGRRAGRRISDVV